MYYLLSCWQGWYTGVPCKTLLFSGLTSVKEKGSLARRESKREWGDLLFVFLSLRFFFFFFFIPFFCRSFFFFFSFSRSPTRSHVLPLVLSFSFWFSRSPSCSFSLSVLSPVVFPCLFRIFIFLFPLSLAMFWTNLKTIITKDWNWQADK